MRPLMSSLFILPFPRIGFSLSDGEYVLTFDFIGYLGDGGIILKEYSNSSFDFCKNHAGFELVFHSTVHFLRGELVA